MMESLAKIYERYASTSFVTGTDKGTIHTYITQYETLFAPFRTRQINLLEVGIASGKSLLMWADYFPTGNIYGVDIAPIPDVIKGNPRIHCFRCDSTSKDLYTALENVTFDIIIDDGCHDRNVQLATAALLWPKVNMGGLYIVEDISGKTVTIFRSLYPTIHLQVAGSEVKNDRMLIMRK